MTSWYWFHDNIKNLNDYTINVSVHYTCYTYPSVGTGHKNRLIFRYVKVRQLYVLPYLNYSIFIYDTLKTSNNNRKQREKENILGVITNSTVNIMILSGHISFDVSSIWGIYKSTWIDLAHTENVSKTQLLQPQNYFCHCMACALLQQHGVSLW